LQEQGLTSPRVTLQAFTFRTPNFSLDTIFVQSSKELVKVRAQINPVQVVPSGLAEAAIKVQGGIRRPDLHVAQPTFLPNALSYIHQHRKLLGVGDEWFTVIRKRERHQPITGKPASHDAKHHPIVQPVGRLCRRDGNRLKAVGQLQCTEPPAGMKYGCGRMAFG